MEKRLRRRKTGGKNGEKKTGKKKEKRLMEIVATTSLPAVGRPNAHRSCQKSHEQVLKSKYFTGLRGPAFGIIAIPANRP